uniref:Putative secreted protein n=1 Tax=Ixodes ricinus TaxID=34613 RepID=A0A6B0TVV9_IXORI
MIRVPVWRAVFTVTVVTAALLGLVSIAKGLFYTALQCALLFLVDAAAMSQDVLDSLLVAASEPAVWVFSIELKSASLGQ